MRLAGITISGRKSFPIPSLAPDAGQLSSFSGFGLSPLDLGAMALVRSCRAAFAPLHRANRLHTSAVLSARQNAAAAPASTKLRRVVPDLEPLKFDDEVLEDQVPAEDDAPEPTHKYLEQQRNMLYYLRLIEHEMPKLVGE